MNAASLVRLKSSGQKVNGSHGQVVENLYSEPFLRRLRLPPSNHSLLIVACSQPALVESIAISVQSSAKSLAAEILKMHCFDLHLHTPLLPMITVTCYHSPCLFPPRPTNCFFFLLFFFLIPTHSRPLILSFTFILLSERLVRQWCNEKSS